MQSNNLLLSSAAALCLLLYTAQAQAADALTPEQTEAVKQVILNNPEIIVKALQTYEEKQHAQQISKAVQNMASMQPQLIDDPLSPSAGNPNGDVTVVEFFDYHCGYCKHFYPMLSQLISEDKKIRVVFKEFPILSPDSAVAARAALAVNSIDKSKYFAFHTALMQSSGAFDEHMLTEKAKEVGISAAAFEKAMRNPALEKEIEKNKELAQALGIGGTPVIIVGTQFIPGAVGLDALKEKVAITRKANKQKSS